ncbi:MAG: thiamine diphosphokinase [Chloroflexi bacterium]|nr:MAG: thiamine diphosphokinase [Chloroflexota bacterium]
MPHCAVVGDGETPDRTALDGAWPGWSDDLGFVVAADAGAIGAEALGLRVDLVVGDGDSLGDAGIARVRDSGIEIRLSPAEKDESDTELGILACLDRTPSRITILGAFGGPRLDHTLANIALLAMPELGGLDVRMLDERTRVRLMRADGAATLPFGEGADGITTAGLAYPLRGEPLLVGRVRGLSNVRSNPVASIRLERGRLLVIESPATL